METKLISTKFSFSKMFFDISTISDKKTIAMSISFKSIVNDETPNILLMNLDVLMGLEELNLFDIKFNGRFEFDGDDISKEDVKEFGEQHGEERVYNEFAIRFEDISRMLSAEKNSIPLPSYTDLIEFNMKKERESK